MPRREILPTGLHSILRLVLLVPILLLPLLLPPPALAAEEVLFGPVPPPRVATLLPTTLQITPGGPRGA